MGTSSALENLYKSMTYDPASRCLYAMSGQFTHENTYINHTVTEVLGTPGRTWDMLYKSITYEIPVACCCSMLIQE